MKASRILERVAQGEKMFSDDEALEHFTNRTYELEDNLNEYRRELMGSLSLLQEIENRVLEAIKITSLSNELSAERILDSVKNSLADILVLSQGGQIETDF